MSNMAYQVQQKLREVHEYCSDFYSKTMTKETAQKAIILVSIAASVKLLYMGATFLCKTFIETGGIYIVGRLADKGITLLEEKRVDQSEGEVSSPRMEANSRKVHALAVYTIMGLVGIFFEISPISIFASVAFLFMEQNPNNRWVETLQCLSPLHFNPPRDPQEDSSTQY